MKKKKSIWWALVIILDWQIISVTLNLGILFFERQFFRVAEFPTVSAWYTCIVGAVSEKRGYHLCYFLPIKKTFNPEVLCNNRKFQVIAIDIL